MLIIARPRLNQQLASPRSPRAPAAPARRKPVSPLSLVAPACQGTQEAGTGTGAPTGANGGSGREIGAGVTSSRSAAATVTSPDTTGKSLSNGLNSKGATTTTGKQGATSLQIVLAARPTTTGARGATIGITTPQRPQIRSDRKQLVQARGPEQQARGPLQRKRLEAKWLKGPVTVQRPRYRQSPRVQLPRLQRRLRVQHLRRLSGALQLLTEKTQGTEAKWLKSRAHRIQ